MTENTPKKPTTRKKPAPRDTSIPAEVERMAEAEKTLTPPVEEPELLKETRTGVLPEESRPLLYASGLVAYNEVARNSQSVRAVQDELDARGHWNVRADDAGYWGVFTQDAALAETDETDPVKAAEALGFSVLQDRP